MEILEAIDVRHSIRQYDARPVEKEKLDRLQQEVDMINQESGLHIQLVTDEPTAFDTRMAHYGKFAGVKNYIALVGKKGDTLDEQLGYYGARLCLLAVTMGLGTCFVGLTFGKRKEFVDVQEDEKFRAVICFGYAAEEPKRHKIKTYEQVTDAPADVPVWFRRGVEAALKAPTAVNQQKFKISLDNDGKVSFRVSGIGFFAKMDLGIVRYFFEVGKGDEA